MVADNLKFDFKPKETHCFIPTEKYTPKIANSKYIFWLWVLPLLVVLTSSFVLSVYAVLRVQSFKEEVEYLRKEIDKLRSGLVDDDLFDDMRKFEHDDLYADDVAEGRTPQPWLVNGGDDFESDYDVNYEDDEDDDEDGIGKIVEDDFQPAKGNENDNFSQDLTNLMKAGSLTKVGKETVRTRRDVIASTFEGVPINAESYSDMKKKNRTIARARQQRLKLYGTTGVAETGESGYQSPAWLNKHHATQGLTHYNQLDAKKPTPPPAPIVTRKSRVMHVDDKSKAFRRVVNKPQLKSGSHLENVEEQVGGPEVTIIRDEHIGHHRRNRHRQRNNNLETLDERPRAGRGGRPLPAIHFSGDTSRYVFGQHANYRGNGHLQHPEQIYVDWKLSDWVKAMGMEQYFQMHQGNLKIKEAGLYFVYAQIFYLDEHDTNGYRVYRNQETLLQCTTMTHSERNVTKGNTCYTAGVEYLNEGDQISVQDLAEGRYSLFEPGKSFFGVVKLGDVKIK